MDAIVSKPVIANGSLGKENCHHWRRTVLLDKRGGGLSIETV
jgi:hypothetical protein